MGRTPPGYFQGQTISVRHLNRWLQFLTSLRIISTPTVRVEEWTEGGVKLAAGKAKPVEVEMTPFQVYPHRYNPAVPESWRMILVHAGLINDQHPRKDGDDTFSDDSDIDDQTQAIKADAVAVLETGTSYFVVLVQTRDVESNWGIDKTFLMVVEDQTGDEIDPFPGYAAGEKDIFKNVHYEIIARVVVGSDDSEDEDYHQLTIDQRISTNLTTVFATPKVWEPVATTETPKEPGEDDWRTVTIPNPGTTNTQLAVTGLDTPMALTAGSVQKIWLEFTINADTGAATAIEVGYGTTLPSIPEPATGKAPTSSYFMLYQITVPATVNPLVRDANVTKSLLNYQTAEIGFKMNDSNELCPLYTGFYWEG